ncbi:MAG: error-prone DNA polymerase [Planctomycetota bacterium]
MRDPVDFKAHPHPAQRGQKDADASFENAGKPRFDKSAPRAGPAYAELYAQSNFSFLRGASHPDELVAQAENLGYTALALCDEQTLAGVVRAHSAAKNIAFPFIVGAEIHPIGSPRLVLLAPNHTAYTKLSRLISLGRTRADKGSAKIFRDDLDRFREGLQAILVPRDRALSPRTTKNEVDAEAEALRPLLEIFGDRCHLAATLSEGPDDEAKLKRLAQLETTLDCPLVAVGATEAHSLKRRSLRDVLVALNRKTSIAALAGSLAPLRYLRTREHLGRLYRDRPQLLQRSVDLAALCKFSLDELRYVYPDEVGEYDLATLVAQTAAARWPEGVSKKVQGLIDYEMKLIAEMRYESYFLTIYDIVRFARSRGILCQGRGSAANSVVCFCLGITNVNPEQFEMLFERFISKDRNEPPDIDVDFEHERREEVLQYVYERYGRERAALAATVISYRGRSAVRDVGKVMGLSLDQVERLSKSISDRHSHGRFEDERILEAGLDPKDEHLQRILKLVREIRGFPRHLSQHVGGMVITQGRLDEIVPIENAAMENRSVIQWDKDDLQALGLMKVDCLALGMLTAIRKAFALIKDYRGRDLTLATVPREVPAVYEMAGRADTIGVFQIESRAQMAMLPRFLPKCFYDLVIEIAIVRPGPIQGGMVHPYLRRRAGREKVEYPSEAVRGVLGRTLGVPIFQEQVMKLAVVAAGFSPGEADQLRRAMAAWRKRGTIGHFRERLLRGMAERGYREDFAEALFRQIEGFGEYGFPESHAASFAHLTYVSLWLKRFEPAAFTSALLNSLPMGFYGPSQLIGDARRHGVDVRAVDVMKSGWDCHLEIDENDDAEADDDGKTIDRKALSPSSESPSLLPSRYGYGGPALRLGLRTLRGFAKKRAQTLIRARKEQPFRFVEDCVQRSGLNRREAALLASAGAFDALSQHRREAYWQAGSPRVTAPLFDAEALREPAPNLAEPSLREQVFADYRSLGYSLTSHPVALVRKELDRRRILGFKALSAVDSGQPVAVAGLCICRQKPATASGIMFVTLEDEDGAINVIVRVKVQERFRKALLGATFMMAKGVLERADGVTHLMAGYLENMDFLLTRLDIPSRDFH